MNPNDDGNHFDLANEQDSIAINSDSLGSDRRYSKKRWHDKEMISQSSATFVNKQTTGGYYRPDKIKNVDLLKDPSLLKEQMA